MGGEQELAAADEQREQQRLVEQQHEKDVASRKQTVASAMDQEEKDAAILSSQGGPKVVAPKRLPDSHVEDVSRLASQRKIRIAEDVTRSLNWPFTGETNGTLVERMVGELSLLPSLLLNYWQLQLPDYLEVIANDVETEFAAAYIPSQNRAFVEVQTWLEGPGPVLEEAVHILDHGLGSNGVPFSAGGGINSIVQAHGQRFSDLFQADRNVLGEYGAKNSREFLAWAVRLYHSADRNKLAKDAPPVFEFIEQVWLNEGTWKEALSENLPRT